jgi:uncharacterized iron-regulated membrane protein
MSESDHPRVLRSWPDYRTVWRWHFYAGLFCIPFVVVLAISGSIYLFKTEIESWIDRPYDRLAVTGHPATAADQVRAALAAVPGSTLNAYELPEAADSAVRVIVDRDGKATRVYLHPESLNVLKTVGEDDRLMRVLFRLHGELLMGNRGSALVELAASWTIIMIVTGLCLWWPRGANGLRGVVYPRLGSGQRVFWRDMHAVTGFWISGLALLMLISGLPWAKFWGDYFKTARRLTGTAVARQDWTNGAVSSAGARESGGSGGHNHGTGWRRRARNTPSDLSALDRIVATVRPMGLDAPVVIEPPSAGSDDWAAKSMTPNRPRRVDLVVDGKTGAVKDRKDFADRHLIDRIVGTGVAAHEGRLFGWPNQLLGLTTAIGLLTLSVSSVVLWWRRREPGVLGAPRALAPPRFSAGLLTLVVLFGIYLPMFGASLVLVLLLEATLLRRIPMIRDWLGLPAPAVRARAVTMEV